MDIVAHALWAGAAARWLRRKRRLPDGRAVAALVALAVIPDIVPLAPALAWSFTQAAPLEFLSMHIGATPATEPPMPLLARELAHHLHCVLHSAVVAGAVTALVAWKRRTLLLPLLGWWLHIALDVPTHSRDYYPVPVFYPFTYWGVDGIAWTAPWLLAANYVALAAVYLWLWLRGRNSHTTALSNGNDGGTAENVRGPAAAPGAVAGATGQGRHRINRKGDRS